MERPDFPEEPVYPEYFTVGMHVMFAFLTLFTVGLGLIPWIIVYVVQRRAEERDYDELMELHGEEMAEYNAALARYQAKQLRKQLRHPTA